jgi:hypothetical protein
MISKKGRQIIGCVLLVFLSALACAVCESGARQVPTVVVRVGLESQDSPVQVLGLKRPERPDHYPLVHLRNTSSRQTVQIWIAALVRGRDGKVVRINSDEPNERWPAERTIPPGDDAWAQEIILQSGRLVFAGKNLHSSCLDVTIIVMRVEFADGSLWNQNPDQNEISLGIPRQSDGEDACKNSTATEAEVEQIAGFGMQPTPNLDVSVMRDEVQSYSFSCSLVLKKGGLIALCPA